MSVISRFLFSSAPQAGGWFVESYRPGVFEVAVESETLHSATFGFCERLG